MNDDFMEFCKTHYKPRFYSKNEFKDDLQKIINIKKMIGRYLTKHVINERLILNNIITLINQFGVYATNVILFYKLDPKMYPAIKSFLLFLNCYHPNILTDDVIPDHNIEKILAAL